MEPVSSAFLLRKTLLFVLPYRRGAKWRIHSIYLKKKVEPYILVYLFILFIFNFITLIDFESKLCVPLLQIMPLTAWDSYSVLQFNFSQ
jgi:hypothetical protein